MSVYRYLKEWRKNPHLSFSCCLALLLPLNDLQGEMSGFSETDVLESQIKSGEMGMSTILIAMEDSGAVEERRKEQGENGKRSYDDAMETQEYNFQHTVFNKKCNQATQTELLKLSLI